jgi:tellurite methyltransferase
MIDLHREFGDIDIYLFDQLLRGRIAPGMRILDAGCGGGRNLVYLLRAGFDVCATDADTPAVAAVRTLARTLGSNLAESNFRVEAIEELSFHDASFDVVISSAVLHFARDDRQFDAMVRSMWRVLKPGGLLFARLASTIGIERLVQPVEGRRHLLPDGSQRYLVDEAMLADLAGALDGTLVDPIKTTVVQGQRAMTTWVLRKNRMS